MLRELHIQNLAIIEKVEIQLAPGLNVFTGQTGAGKSLILGSLELLLGLRNGGDEAALMVRPGCGEARVSGVFEVACPQRLQRLSEVVDQPLAPGEPILITRRLSSTGRSSVSINGLPATAAQLRAAGQMLVDIHGQHDQQVLLKPSNQLAILDAFAEALDERRSFADALRELRSRQQRLRDLRDSEQRRLEALELYRFQLEEIDKANLRPGQYDQARRRYGVLKNAASLKTRSSQVLQALSEGEDTLLERTGSLARCVQELLRMDGSLAGLSGLLEQAQDVLQEAARTLEQYQDGLEIDQGELQRVEERLDVLNRLIHKYARLGPNAEDPLASVLGYREQIALKLRDLEADDRALAGLEGEIRHWAEQASQIGSRLTRLRRQAGKRLKALVEAQFRELEMNEAQFDLHLRSRSIDEPDVDSSGLDEMEFLVRTNPGQEMLPLRKVASGGEMSRIMLALKTILADKDQVSVLVFDEIDSNIGDRLGATIGRKMRALAHGRRERGTPTPHQAGAHQILCVTHLSQIAACADHHLQIAKDVVGPPANRQTLARVRVLEGEARVRELAEMMAGKNATAATLQHARTLVG